MYGFVVSVFDCVFQVFGGLFFLLVCLFVLFCFVFTATHVPYGSSWAKGQVGAAPARLLQITATATPEPSHLCDLSYSLWQCWILNPVNKARDQTRILMDTT